MRLACRECMHDHFLTVAFQLAADGVAKQLLRTGVGNHCHSSVRNPQRLQFLRQQVEAACKDDVITGFLLIVDCHSLRHCFLFLYLLSYLLAYFVSYPVSGRSRLR